MSSESKSLLQPLPAGGGPPPQVGQIFQRLTTFVTINAVATLSELGVFDTMAQAGKPLSAAEIAQLNGNGLNSDILHRALRSATVDGWVKENAEAQFELQDARFLVTGPQSLKAFFEVLGVCPSHNSYKPFFGDVLKTGGSAAQKGLGMDPWTWFDKNPDKRDRFARAMSDFTAGTAPAIAAAFNFKACQTVVDIGGSEGILAHQLKQAHPHLRAITFDLPTLTEAVSKKPLPGIEYVGGSFFEYVPEADVYTASHIFHDWADADCVRILECLSKSIRPNGRLLIIDAVLPEPSQPFPSPLVAGLDLLMASVVGAKERSRPMWDALLLKGGFEIVAVSPPLGPVNVIECRKK